MEISAASQSDKTTPHRELLDLIFRMDREELVARFEEETPSINSAFLLTALRMTESEGKAEILELTLNEEVCSSAKTGSSSWGLTP